MVLEQVYRILQIAYWLAFSFSVCRISLSLMKGHTTSANYLINSPIFIMPAVMDVTIPLLPLCWYFVGLPRYLGIFL